MLLIDGVKFEEWKISNEDELEKMVIEHAQDIFSENSIYFDKKQKLKSLAGVGSIPDGLSIILGDTPQWHIVEVELSSHDPYEHVVPQVDKFINAVDNPNSRNKIVEALYEAVENDESIKVKIRQTIGQNKDIHKYLFDLIVKPPTITIIIEQNTEQLKEAIKKYTQNKVVVFQTFRREKAETVHAHLFNPLDIYASQTRAESKINIDTKLKGSGEQGRVTAKALVESGFLKVGQKIYRIYRGQRYEGKVLYDGMIELINSGKKYPTLNAAIKGITETPLDAWYFWNTTREDGTECPLAELREEYRAKFLS